MSLRFHSVKQWIRTHRTRTIIGVGVVVILVTAGGAFALLSQPKEVITTAPIAVKPRPKPLYSALTGVKVKTEDDLTKPVTAIMIENSPEARPQSGLKQAEVVYEAIAEGGVTRFLALYQQNKPDLIGPVRSVRPYYIDWVMPYNASIAHVGGSAAALKEIRNGNYRDLDQFSNPDTFWRTTDRFAPHNVYTSFNNLDALNKKKDYTSSKPKGFERTDIKPAAKPNATSIDVAISGPQFDSSYKYSTAKKYYVRSQAGAAHKDREDGTITPKVVIVMEVAQTEELQETTREVIQTTGSGAVTIFQGGNAVKGTWQRKSRDDQFTFVGADKKPIELDRGQTWITAVPAGKGSVSWR